MVEPSRTIDPPTGAYIHVPFCRHRCGYCNFTLVAGRDDLIQAYLDCLEIELAERLQHPQPMATLFLGGGTPTHLPNLNLQRLLDLINHWLPLEADGEFSCEANPLDCTNQCLDTLVSGGVNRLSIGGQSFNDAKLRTLERDHDRLQLVQTIDRASRYFQNVSLDLIFASPNESLEVWQNDLQLALASPIQHLSTYGLTIERGANFYGRWLHGQLHELDESMQLEMYLLAIDQLHASGWQHYEVSNFCLPEHQCRHNQTYWQGNFWWGFGPGAASFLPHRQSSQPTWIRSTNHRSTTQYIRHLRTDKNPVAEIEHIDLEQRIREQLVFGLRQLSGISLQKLSQQLEWPARELFEPYLSRYIEQGWLVEEEEQLRLTRAGLVISDSLWPDLLQGN